ncbi:ABC-type transport auxiliary lipoprotein family protein [Phenylobacterium aquaticum]|uniref:ABC-type transport auxiliary lipoprotein family protein n=1 Tax=Phenylobacterium aquaticum TaxID=1763816 RepID=UPI001F5DF83C|nr:ABC-type transport auxiliary lipoprotein family protein [Phenylobacterium aquaticum]MCI3132016.1 ABC-type transport auxiliary lipoprotein family protein [Phenylobacterium aquaticum]
MNRTWIRAAGLVALALSLSACVTVFPKAKPATLYRFQGDVAAVGPAAKTRIGVARANGSFNGAASGDRILTVTGPEVAYVAEARWAEPAVTLFDEALARAFNANTGAARLVTRGEPSRADYSLRLDVQRFEADYDHGGKAAPRVAIDVHAVLVRASDRAVVGDELFSVAVRARENRVSAIVAAFDAGVSQLLGKLVAWANAGVAAG